MMHLMFRLVNNDGAILYYRSLATTGSRPSINLKSEVKVVSGAGTKDNPYRLSVQPDNSR